MRQGLAVKKRGVHLGRKQWQKGSRLREDGKQWAGRLAGILRWGPYEGCPWPSTPTAEAAAPQGSY